MQLPYRLPSQPRARLRNARLARHLDRHRRIEQPLDALQQTAKHLAIRRVHIQSQRDHVVDHDMSRKIALPDTGCPGRFQNRVHLCHREGFCNHPETDVVGDPAAFRKGRNRSRHLALSPDSEKTSVGKLWSTNR